jgi:hypothetical protein
MFALLKERKNDKFLLFNGCCTLRHHVGIHIGNNTRCSFDSYHDINNTLYSDLIDIKGLNQPIA